MTSTGNFVRVIGTARTAASPCWTRISASNDLAATFLENQARRIGCKGLWVGSLCRFVPLGFTATLVVISVASLRGPDETLAKPIPSDVPSIPRRSLLVRIDTATKPETCFGTPLVPLEKRLQVMAYGLPSDEAAELERLHMVPSTMVPTADILNFGLKNVRATADEQTLYLAFEYDLDVFHRFGQQRKKIGTFPLLIRLFDAQGEYLKHFTTTERFAPASLVELELLEVIGAKNPEFANSIFPVKAKGNQVAYAVNARDLQFAEIVEVGFDANGSPGTGELTGVSVQEFHSTDGEVAKARTEFAESVRSKKGNTP